MNRTYVLLLIVQNNFIVNNIISVDYKEIRECFFN